jgi:hypothetical protein
VAVLVGCSSTAERASNVSDSVTSAPGLTRSLPTSIRSACKSLARKEARQRIDRPVFCPPLVPSARPQIIQSVSAADGNSVSPVHLRTGYLVSAFSPKGGAKDGFGHWTFAAGDASVLRAWIYTPDAAIPQGKSAPAAPQPERTRHRLHGQVADIFRIPLHRPGDVGLYAGHVVVQWRQLGTTFQVSLHGQENSARAEAIAAALVLEVRHCTKSSAPRGSRKQGCALVFRPG